MWQFLGVNNMNSVIVFMSEGIMRVMNAFDGSGFTTLETAKKDVPKGVPFWIISESLLPPHEELAYAEINIEKAGDPDGFGGTFIYPSNGDDENVQD